MNRAIPSNAIPSSHGAAAIHAIIGAGILPGNKIISALQIAETTIHARFNMAAQILAQSASEGY